MIAHSAEGSGARIAAAFHGDTMERMDETTKKILEIVTDMQENNATKADIQAAKNDIKNLDEKLDSVRRDLQTQISENTKAISQMAEELRSVFGYAKEIDVLMTRMAAVEKHVGIMK